MNRVAIFLLAPLPAAAMGGLVSWGMGAHPRGLSVTVFYLLQLYVLQFLFGLAIYAWLRRTGRRSIVSFALGGLVMVAIVAVPYLLWASFTPENTTSRTGIILILWLILGAISGATTWVIGRQGNRLIDGTPLPLREEWVEIGRQAHPLHSLGETFL